MIQTYNDIGGQVRQFERNWNGDGQLQKIYSSARFVSVSLRSAGATTFLFFGRGKGFEGFWTGAKQIPASLRKKDQFLEYLRKHLSGARLLGVELDKEDRILRLRYQKFGKENLLGLFYHGRKLYFANQYYDQKSSSMKIFRSWNRSTYEDPFENVFLEVGKAPQDQTIKSATLKNIEELLENEKAEGLSGKKKTSKGKKFLERKITNIRGDLEKASKWPIIIEWLDSQTDLGELAKKVNVGGVKIKFGESSHFKRRDEVFTKVKKLKKGQGILENRLSEAIELANSKTDGDSDISTLEVIKPVWGKEPAQDKVPPRTEAGGYKLYKEDGFEIGVGTSSKGNDQLRKVWAKKDDWWFHLEAGVSPHVIAKVDVVDPEVLDAVAKKMVAASGSFDGPEVNLIYTQVKNLKGVPGKTGSVNYKKEKHVRIYVDKSN